MIEEFAAMVPDSLRSKSGEVFYSGRCAFDSHADLYILGSHPSSNPDDPRQRIVEENVKHVLHKARLNWSSYRDERWNGKKAGTALLQESVLHLCSEIEHDPGLIPSSNLAFVRSQTSEMSEQGLLDLCWPFHQRVIDAIRPKVVLCLNAATAEELCRMLGGEANQIDELQQTAGQFKRHKVFISHGLLICALLSPFRGKWTNPALDPSPLVKRTLAR